MAHVHSHITRHELEDTFVASMRLRGQVEDIAPRLAQIRAAAGARAAGPGIVIYHDHNPDIGHDLEVCVPVSEAVAAAGITCHVLPGGPWLGITHIGPYQDTLATWRVLGAHIREYCIGIAEDPMREVYVEGPETHGDDTSRYVTELMIPLLMPRWIAYMAEGLEQLAGAEARDAVLTGDMIDIETDPARKVAWAQGLMQRLDTTVTDETIKCRIMNGCAHRFPQERIDFLREKFHELGGVDALLRFMGEDKSMGGRSYYAAPRREGMTVIETKDPARPEAYAAATDPREKRAAACFCPIVRQAILTDAALSDTWCHCGAGWFTQLWGGIFGQPVQVEVLETVRDGGERCMFRVHIPDGVAVENPSNGKIK
ncbi:MAG: GyrI-like domain-containing protein [Anaerolineae bacterium]|nr:GyrI-like domain-containing protein [Anaerolineae bacterium]